MEKNIFDIYWNFIFIPMKNSIVSEIPNTSFNSQSKDIIYEKYEEYRSNLRTHFLNSNHRIDRHKMCALFIKAIIVVKPFTVTTNTMPAHLYINELYSIKVALAMLTYFCKYYAIENNDERRFYIFHNNGILLPECYSGDYLIHFAKSLCYDEQFEINILLLSLIFFTIEKFTITLKLVELLRPK